MKNAMNETNHRLYKKYQVTSWFYDILDYPWERQYRRWRPSLLEDVTGSVLEAGIGTGRNLRCYRPEVRLTAIDLSPGMMRIAKRRARKAACTIRFLCLDATRLSGVPSNHFDWYLATFLFCVMPDELQPAALAEMVRVLKPGGRFKILEIIFSNHPHLLKRQKLLAPFVERVYGARFDRRTLEHLRENEGVEVSQTRFLKADMYLL
ncbi:MAG: class I SAM-dependent methyltransferase, partial [Planctomycetota bacterium]